MRPCYGALGLVVGFFVSTGIALAASDAPRGNGAAIALYARSAKVNGAYEEISFSGHGARYSVGKKPNDLIYALAFDPPGTRPAIDHVSVIQRGGKVVEEIDTLTAAGEPALTIWIAGASWSAQVQRPGACVMKLRSEYGNANFATPGEPFVDSTGSTFAALQHRGGSSIVRSTYKDEGANADETDTIASATGLWQSSRVTYSGGPYSKPATTSMTSFSYKRSAPVIQPPKNASNCAAT